MFLKALITLLQDIENSENLKIFDPCVSIKTLKHDDNLSMLIDQEIKSLIMPRSSFFILNASDRETSFRLQNSNFQNGFTINPSPGDYGNCSFVRE